MISSRKKVTLSRDDYREFTHKVAQLQEANYEFVHVVTRNEEDDTFTIDCLLYTSPSPRDTA